MTFSEKYKQVMKMTDGELPQEDINELVDLAETALEMFAVEEILKILANQRLKSVCVVAKK